MSFVVVTLEYTSNVSVTVTVCALTVIYSILTITFAVKGKKTVYRLFFSVLILLALFLILLYVVQKTGPFAVFQDEEKYKEYLESAGVWMPVLYLILQYLQVVVLVLMHIVSCLK